MHAVAFARDLRAHCLQHSLGMVSRLPLLDDTHLDARHDTGQQNRTLHLRAGRPGIPVDAVQLRAMNRHRQTVAVSELGSRAHRGEWVSDALHWASTQAGVAFEAGAEGMRRHYPSDETSGGAAVPAIERGSRLPETQSDAAHLHVLAEGRDGGSEGAEYARGRAHIL